MICLVWYSKQAEEAFERELQNTKEEAIDPSKLMSEVAMGGVSQSMHIYTHNMYKDTKTKHQTVHKRSDV